MGDALRQRRAPAELAETGQVIEINDKISDYGRLTEIVSTDLAALDTDQVPSGWRDRDVTGWLEFGYVGGERSDTAVEGEVEVDVDAVCQRCLEPFRLPLSVRLKLLMITPEQVATSREGYETWELADRFVEPAEIVEEALIMAMPLSAMHAGACRTAARDTYGERTTRPFASLRAQMEATKDPARRERGSRRK